MSDVWEIPYLNPKAKERVGYPTQKPIILLEQIIKLVTDEGDLVLDPFVGSGTTLVAAKMLNRNYLGFDISEDAVPVQRNSGIDGFLKEHIDGGSISIRIQREDETLGETIAKLTKASKTKQCSYMGAIRTHKDIFETVNYHELKSNIIILSLIHI